MYNYLSVLSVSLSVFLLGFLENRLTAGEFGPWSATPLGSWIEFDRDRGLGDGTERVRTTVIYWSLDGRVELNSRRIDRKSWSESPLQGIDLAKYGFVQEGAQISGEEEVAGNRVPCLITRYQRRGGKKPADEKDSTKAAVNEHLVLYLAATLPIPARTIQFNNNRCLNLPTGVVRCEWTSFDAVTGTRIVSRITDLGQRFTIGEQSLDCVSEELQSFERDGDGPWENAGTWESLLCEGVPGHVVSTTTRVRPFGEPARTFQVKAFYRAEKIDPAACLRKLSVIPPDQRPVIPGPEWAGLKAGSWSYSASLINPTYGGDRASLLRRQVIEVRPNGSWIESVQNDLTGVSEGYSLIEPPPINELAQPLNHPSWPPLHEGAMLVRVGERSIDWEGGKLACEWALYRGGGGKANNWSGPSDIRLYRPITGPLRDQLNEANHLWLTRIIKSRSDYDSSNRVDRVVSFDKAITIDGVERRGVLVEQETKSGDSGTINVWALLSSRVPGGVIASFEKNQRYNLSHECKMLIAFGALEDSIPKITDGRSLAAVSALCPTPFTNHAFAGQPIGTEVIYTVTAKIGAQEGTSRIAERVEGGTWVGIPLMKSYRLEDGMRLHLETRAAQVSMDPAPQLKLSESREEQLTIGGRSVACTHKTWSGVIGAEKWTLERWSGDQKFAPYRETTFGTVRLAVPAGTLKETVRIDCGNFSLLIDRAVTKLDEEVKLAGSTWSCSVEDWKLSTTGQLNVAQSGTLWLSGRFPGHRVKIHTISRNADSPEEQIEQHADSIAALPNPLSSSSGSWTGVAIGGWVEYAITTDGSRPWSPARIDSIDQNFRLHLSSILPDGTPIITSSGKHPDLGDLPQTLPEAMAPEFGLSASETTKLRIKWNGAEHAGTRTIWSDAGDTCRLDLTVIEALDGLSAPFRVGQASVMLPASCSEAEMVVLQGGIMLRAKRTLLPEKAELIVAGQTLNCWRDTITMESVDTKTGNAQPIHEEQRWLNGEVPGIIVRSERKLLRDSQGPFERARVTSVVAYSKNP